MYLRIFEAFAGEGTKSGGPVCVAVRHVQRRRAHPEDPGLHPEEEGRCNIALGRVYTGTIPRADIFSSVRGQSYVLT